MQEYCTSCGAKLQGKAQFCVSCGKPVIASDKPDRKQDEAREQLRFPEPAVAKKRSRRGLFLAALLLLLGGALAGGYFYLTAYRPELVASIKTRLFGGSSPEQTATSAQAPSGSGLTTAQLRAQWAERALKEGRLVDADAQIKQAEELEPASRVVQDLRAKLQAAQVAQRRAEDERREADRRAVEERRQREEKEQKKRAEEDLERRRSQTTIESITAGKRKDVSYFPIVSKTFRATLISTWKAAHTVLQQLDKSLEVVDQDLWVIVTRGKIRRQGIFSEISEKYFIVVRSEGEFSKVSIRALLDERRDAYQKFKPMSANEQNKHINLILSKIEEELARGDARPGR